MKGIHKLLKRDPRLAFRVDHDQKVVRHLRGNLAKVRSKAANALQSAGLQFIRQHAELFGRVGRNFERINETDDEAGGLSVTLQQYHGKLRVEGGSVRLHRSARRILDTVRNHLFPDLAGVARKARVGAARATRALAKETGADAESPREPELLVFRHEGSPRLAWKVHAVGGPKGERGAPPLWVGYVDARNGKLLFHYDNLQSLGATTGSGTGEYSGTGSVQSWDNGTTYQLRDTSRVGSGGPEIVVNDEDGASPSEDADNNWNDLSTTPRHANQGAEVDAQRYAGAVIDYFQNVHGRNSYDGAGGTVTILCHYGTDLADGYWNGSQVQLGDGDGVTEKYECSDDWLAHEITHAYTEKTCALDYVKEAGALNEAFSDVFAAFITGDWLVFEDSWLNTTAPARRNMMDPTNGGNWKHATVAEAKASWEAGHIPDHWDERFTGIEDSYGVHSNCGIIDNLFYLLTVGGTNATSGLSVTGVGQPVAEKLLFRCMSVNLVGLPSAKFLDFRQAMLDACLDLYPDDLHLLTQVKQAFNAVGIGPDLYVRDNVADTGEEPYTGSYLWASPDIINRTSPSANPAVDFANLSDDALWENVEAGQENSIYVRLQNRGNAAGDATVNVYFSAASTFGTPASWLHIGTLTETAIAPGTLRIAGPLPFPASMIPAPGHYCMIAVVTDALDPAPDHTLIASVADYLDFVRNTNNIAYRNMNVVDMVAGASGEMVAHVAHMADADEPYDVHLDLARFVPGARVRVRVPARAVAGANAIGLKLLRRGKREHVYEVLVGRERARNLKFLGRAHARAARPGFERLRLERDFRIRVQYVLPVDDKLHPPRARAPQGGYRLALRQTWRGEPVGAVALQLIPPRKTKKGKRPARKK